jgi:hypothetical protein
VPTLCAREQARRPLEPAPGDTGEGSVSPHRQLPPKLVGVQKGGRKIVRRGAQQFLSQMLWNIRFVAWRTHRRSVSALIPNLPAIALIADHSVS